MVMKQNQYQSGFREPLKNHFGGKYIFQSDHSVANNLSGHTYDYIVKVVREYGKYPLNLGEYDL
jgi:hypothetical protein